MERSELRLKEIKALAENSAKKLCKKISGEQVLLRLDRVVDIQINVVVGLTEPLISCIIHEYDIKYMPLVQLGLSVRTTNLLEIEDIKTVDDLINKSVGDLLSIRSFGQTNLKEVRRRLTTYNLKLKGK